MLSRKGGILSVFVLCSIPLCKCTSFLIHSFTDGLLVGMQTGAATVENSMEFPQKTENGSAFWPSDFKLLDI